MAKASTRKQKKTRLKAANFPLPKHLSQEQVSDICATLRISARHVAEFKGRLDHLVDEVNGWMAGKKTRQSDRTDIISMRKRIAAAQVKVKGLGINGRLALRSAAAPLADVLSGDWLRYRFPGDAPSKPTLGGVCRPARSPPTKLTSLKLSTSSGATNRKISKNN